MSGYNKIVPSIVQSSIWNEDPEIRIVWITMIALKDWEGTVKGNPPVLARLANVSLDKVEEALEKFRNPDPYSNTPEYEGRRIEDVPGGWKVLNSDKYREEGMTEARREYWRELKKKKNKESSEKVPRSSKKSKEGSEKGIGKYVSVSVSESVSGKMLGEEGMQGGEREEGTEAELPESLKDDAEYDRLVKCGWTVKPETWMQLKRNFKGADPAWVVNTVEVWAAEGEEKPKSAYKSLTTLFSKNEAQRIQEGIVHPKTGKLRDHRTWQEREADEWEKMTPEERLKKVG